MRILAAFFSILFSFINPAMFYNVLSESDWLINYRLPEHLALVHLSWFAQLLNEIPAIRSVIHFIVISMSLFHLVFTLLSLYAIYSCRPGVLKGFLINILVSLAILMLFFLLSLTMYFHFNTKGQIADRETTKRHLRNVYVSGAFLLAYGVWLAVSFSAYKDTDRLRRDFMYWIVEERLSQQCRHNVSVDRSRSSKGSSRSVKSVKSEQIMGFKSAVYDRKCSLVNATLSVPL